MKRSKSKITLIILFCAALLAALGGGAVLFFAMENDFDVVIRHFEFGSLFDKIATVVCAGGAALGIAGFFCASKKLNFTEKDNKCTFAGMFTSVLAGLMCCLLFGVGVKGGIPEEKPGILLAELTFTVLSAAFFFLKAFGLFSKKPAAALSGLLPALMCAFMILDLYFNSAEPLNAPLKIYEIVMLASFMLFFTAEAGIMIKRPSMNRKFAFAGLLATASGGMIAGAKLAARVVDVDKFDFDIIRVAFFAVIWLYIVAAFAEKLFLAREIEKDEAFFDNEDTEGSDIVEAEPDDGEDEAEAKEDEAEDDVEEKTEEAGAEDDGTEEAEEAEEETADESEGSEESDEKETEEKETEENDKKEDDGGNDADK